MQIVFKFKSAAFLYKLRGTILLILGEGGLIKLARVNS